MSVVTVNTEIQDMLKIQHPVLLAGMANVATAKLAAAVSNAGGLGMIGGVTLKPKFLREEIARLQALLDDKRAFGVDLLLPQVGGNARKTNYDYTDGNLPELIDIIAESKCRIFVSAVGVPPKWAVDKLHAAGIVVANIIGHPKHATKALELGVDVIIAQGYEGGGHTGDIASLALWPQVLDTVRGKVSAFTGKQIPVIAAGGVYDGRTAAAAFSIGCAGLWVGTRFVASEEATTSKPHKNSLIKAGPNDCVRTLIYTGRPMRLYNTELVNDFNNNRQAQVREMTQSGVIPIIALKEEAQKQPGLMKQRYPAMNLITAYPMMMGQCAGGITSVLPAKTILETMMADAVAILKGQQAKLGPVRSKL
eukprot:Rhum_TRINITY_DN3195_c0_g1::Rhum_TRINITY_DN3195_c0_g1_i1::g.9650::m.9650